jgi:hypothetical protein
VADDGAFEAKIPGCWDSDFHGCLYVFSSLYGSRSVKLNLDSFKVQGHTDRT